MTRHGPSWWSKRVEELARGGDADEIAKRDGVRARTLIWWRSELVRRRKKRDEKAPRLLPVHVSPSKPTPSMKVVEMPEIDVLIEVGEGPITVRGRVSPAHLSAIVSAVKRC